MFYGNEYKYLVQVSGVASVKRSSAMCDAIMEVHVGSCEVGTAGPSSYLVRIKAEAPMDAAGRLPVEQAIMALEWVKSVEYRPRSVAGEVGHGSR